MQVLQRAGEEFGNAGGVGDRAQHRLGLREAPRARVRPQVQVGDLVVAAEHEGDVAGAVAPGHQVHVADQAQREIHRHRQRDADLHDDAPVGQGIDAGALDQPGQEGDDAEADGGQRQRPQRGGQRVAVVMGGEQPPDEQEAEVDGDLVQVERAAGEGRPVRRALPEDPLAFREGSREAADLLFVTTYGQCLRSGQIR